MLVLNNLSAADFETATEAVKNMAVGWNLGNTLDAHNAQRETDIVRSETWWGQPVTTPQLMVMMKNAGFGAIRIPVTWFPHMNDAGKVDEAWMKRVRQVVDYVLDAGMYCILNVHHDTGADSYDDQGNLKHHHWLHASMSTYNSEKARYEYLWKQIAEEFKDYDQRLLFESFNEMLDDYNSWCFASYNCTGRYDATIAADAYEAINSYVQSFVTTVRATGGNNAQRNLVANTYGACSGGGTWNSHLKDPLKEMKYPNDPAGNGHIIFQVHTYPSIANNNGTNRPMSEIKKEIDDMVNAWNSHLASKGAPVIVGEWGTSNVDKAGNDYTTRREHMFQFVDYFMKKTKENNICTFLWMGLSDGSNRSIPVFNQADLAQRIVQNYYGDTSGFAYPSREDLGPIYSEVTYSDLWGELNLCGQLNTADYQQLELELAEKPAKGAFKLKHYPNQGYQDVTEAKSIIKFNTATMGETLTRITLQTFQAGNKAIVKSVKLVKKDGTTEDSNVSVFWGCAVSEIILNGIQAVEPAVSANGTSTRIFNLRGQQVGNTFPKGLYIRNGKKFVVR